MPQREYLSFLVSRVMGFCCFALLAFSLDPALADDLMQKMRFPVGNYLIGGGGGGGGGGGSGGGSGASGASSSSPSGGTGGSGSIGAGSLPIITLPPNANGPGFTMPAYCIDEGRDPPNTSAALASVSGDAKVFQYDGEKLLGEKPLSEAIAGSEPWLRISGNSSPNDVNIIPTNPKFSYQLLVSGLTIAGQTASDVQPTYQAWTNNSTLMETSKTFDAIRFLILQGGAFSTRSLNRIEILRRDLEWNEFGGGKSGAKIPAKGSETPTSKWIDALISSDLDIGKEGLTKSGRLDWLTLVRGKALGASDFAFMAEQLKNISIANSYDQDPGEAALLTSFSRVSAWSPFMLNKFHQFRAAKLPFDKALRQAAFTVGGEELWTTGQPELSWAVTLDCANEELPSFLPPRLIEGLKAGRARLAAESKEVLDATVKLMRDLNGYSAAFFDSKLVTVSVGRNLACFIQVLGPDKIERQQIPLGSVTPQFIADNFKNSTLVPLDFISQSLLKTQGIAYKSFDNVVRQASVSAFAGADNLMDSELKHFSRKLSSSGGLDLTTLNLDTKGDALVARLPDGTFLMIDTGLGKNTLSKLSTFLGRRYPEKKPPLRIVITHSHQDHIGGVQEIVKDGFEIQEMLVGRSMKDGKAVENLSKVLTGGKTTHVRDVGQPGVSHFVRAGVDPLFQAGRRRVSAGGGIESWTLKSISETEIEVHHVVRARSPNEGGLVVRLGHRGMHWLLCDDLNEAAFATVASNLDETELRAGILKWPHHLWLPAEKKKKDRQIFESFLRAVNPHTIIFSNVGHKSHNASRFKEIKEFVGNVLGPDVRMVWTREKDKHIIVQAEMKLH